jgi:hypothetical protein
MHVFLCFRDSNDTGHSSKGMKKPTLRAFYLALSSL